jgi:flap endonuclease-1
MGIKKNFKKFLKENASTAFKSIPIYNLKGMIIPIDVLSVYYGHWQVAQKNSIKKMGYDIINNEIDNEDILTRFLDLIWRSISKLLNYGIIPILIFDGKAPIEKLDTQTERKDNSKTAKDKINELQEKIKGIPANLRTKPMLEELQTLYNQYHTISKDDLDILKSVFKGMGLSVITAQREAEELCAELVIKGKCYASYSTDSDTLAHNCPIWLYEINKMAVNGKNTDCFDVILLSDVLKELELTKEQFLDFCILLGCDYNIDIYGIGPAKAYDLIVKHKSLDVIKKLGIFTEKQMDDLNYIKCRELFTNKEGLIPDNINLSIDVGCVNTYSNDYLRPYKMEYIVSELSDIYNSIKYERVDNSEVEYIDKTEEQLGTKKKGKNAVVSIPNNNSVCIPNISSGNSISIPNISNTVNTVNIPNLSNTVNIPNISNTVNIPNISNTVNIPNLSNTVNTPNLSNTVSTPNLSNTVNIPNLSNSVIIPNISNTVNTPNISNSISIPNISNSISIPNISNLNTGIPNISNTNSISIPNLNNLLKVNN